MLKKFLGCGGICAVVLVGGLVALALGYAEYSKVWNEGVRIESGLNAQYLKNQNKLSEYVSGFYESFNIAGAKSDRMDEIIKDAVKGRYDGKAGGSLVTAIKEAYPDLSGLNVFDKIVDYVQAKRAEYRQDQDTLLNQLQQYDNWRGQGPIEHLFKGWLFPSDRLEARLGDNVVHGKDARNQMYRIVLASTVKKAYETGIQDPLELPRRERDNGGAAKTGK